MALTIDNDTSLHEAGHCIVAYLAHDLFEIKFVTADLSLSKSQDINSIGGLRGNLRKEVETLTFEDHDLMILICLAGMAADDINHCDNKPTEQLYDNALFAQKMQSNKYSGDSQRLYPYLQRIVPNICIKQRPYTISCQRLLHELFSNKLIMTILLGLRTQIDSKPKKTLTGNEISAYLDITDLKKWRENEWKQLYDSRIKKIKKKNNIIQRFICWRKSYL
jgi:hypothetical protein